MITSRIALLACLGAAVYGGAVAIAVTSATDAASAAVVAVAYAAGLSFTATGVVAIARRPENRTGTLMLATGLLWAIGALSLSSSRWLFTIGAVGGELAFAPLAQLLLAFPSGVLERRYHRMLVRALWVVLAVGPLAIAVADRTPTDCATCPDSAIAVGSSHAAALAAQIAFTVVAMGLAAAVIVELVRLYREASPPRRRLVSPVYATFALALAFLIVSAAVEPFSGAASTVLSAVAVLFVAFVPVAFLAGLLRGRLARGQVLRLLTALEEGIPLREALAGALGDASLAIAYRLGDGRWADAEGRALPEPVAGPGRAVTTVDRRGEPIAALLHDSSLEEEPELVRGVAAAAALTLEAQRAQAELRSQYAYLRTLVDTTPSLLVTVDLEGRIVSHNGAMLEAAGYDDGEQIRGRPFWEVYIAPEERDEVRERFTAASPEFPVGEFENAFTNARGEERVVFWRSAPVRDDEGRVVSLVAGGIDITDRVRREEEVRRAEERFRAVIESAPVAIIEVGLDERVNLWNSAAERIFGWSAEEVLGGPPLWVPEAKRAEFRELSDREALGAGYTSFETVRQRRDGSLVDVEISAAPIRDAAGAVVGAMAVLTDISDRKRQAEEVRASRARIVQAADETRRRLERDLHDGAQQRLVALSVSLTLAEAKLASDPDAAAGTLGAAREELALALEDLRELARGIHPAVLTDRGLAAAVEMLVGRAPLPVDLALPEERLPPAIEAALYYVVAETLTNVAKYAGATSACVRVTAGDGVVVAEVADDGIGGADPTGGSGLRGLADRVEALDGSLAVDSPSGGGTRVRVAIPLVREPGLEDRERAS